MLWAALCHTVPGAQQASGRYGSGGLGFRVKSLGFRLWGVGFGVHGHLHMFCFGFKVFGVLRVSSVRTSRPCAECLAFVAAPVRIQDFYPGPLHPDRNYGTELRKHILQGRQVLNSPSLKLGLHNLLKGEEDQKKQEEESLWCQHV